MIHSRLGSPDARTTRTLSWRVRCGGVAGGALALGDALAFAGAPEFAGALDVALAAGAPGALDDVALAAGAPGALDDVALAAGAPGASARAHAAITAAIAMPPTFAARRATRS
jgi:hypothetical protein